MQERFQAVEKTAALLADRVQSVSDRHEKRFKAIEASYASMLKTAEQAHEGQILWVLRPKVCSLALFVPDLSCRFQLSFLRAGWFRMKPCSSNWRESSGTVTFQRWTSSSAHEPFRPHFEHFV